MPRSSRTTCAPVSPLKEALKAKARQRRNSVKSTPLPTHRRNDLVPALDLVQRAPSSLVIPARNVRQLRQEHVHRVAASIGSLGFCAPILIDETGTVLDGAVRLEAARVLGLESVPCIVAGHLTAAEKRALRLALNRLGERGAWDLRSLRVELQELLIEDLDLEITGFDGAEIDSILLDEEPPSHEPGPLTPDPEAQPRAKPGDVYRLGAHRLICGDARDPAVWARLMGEERARLVLTDEPYNVPIRGHVTGGAHREFAMASGEMSEAEFEAFNETWMRAALEHLVEGGVLGTFIDWRGLPVVQEASRRLGLVPLNLVVWSKTNAGMGSLYRSQHELLPLYKKGEAPHVNNVELGRKGRWRSNVWSYAGASSLGSDARAGLKEHPTVKPVAMLEDALADLTHRGDVVADPFLGSGSTLIAAERTGRRCHAVELDPAYVDLIVRRYKEVTGEEGVLERAGDYDAGAIPLEL